MLQELEKSLHFWRFFGKTTPYEKIFKILFWNFHRDTDRCVVCKFREFGWREIGEIVRCLPDKKNKNSPRSLALLTARIALKICQNQRPTMYWQCSRFHPNRFTFGGVIAERVNTVKTHRKVFPIFGWSLASRRITSRIMTDCLTRGWAYDGFNGQTD